MAETEEIIFHWSREHGDCYDCGRPAAFRAVDCYGRARHEILCSVCAANWAADGQIIERIDQEEDEDG